MSSPKPAQNIPETGTQKSHAEVKITKEGGAYADVGAVIESELARLRDLHRKVQAPAETNNNPPAPNGNAPERPATRNK